MLPEIGSLAERGQTPRITVVIPALNEERNLIEVLPRIPHMVDEVILVDGGSTDRTVETARALMPSIRIVNQVGRGKGAALRTGFGAATGDIIVMLDADGSTNPGEIPAFVGALLSGADFAKGSRFLQGSGTADMTFHRKLGNGAFVQLVRVLFGGRYSDLCYGYNAFWTDVLPVLALDGDGLEIETMMNVRALRAGLKDAEVPSYESRRGYGIGHLRAFPDGLRVLRTIFAELRRPSPAAPGQRRLADQVLQWPERPTSNAPLPHAIAETAMIPIPVESETIAMPIDIDRSMVSEQQFARSGDDRLD